MILDRVITTVPGALTSEPWRDQALSSGDNQRTWEAGYENNVPAPRSDLIRSKGMGRRPRMLLAGAGCHVCARVPRGQQVFRDDSEKERFKALPAEAGDRASPRVADWSRSVEGTAVAGELETTTEEQ